jgi:predicted RNase H-like nuclease
MDSGAPVVCRAEELLTVEVEGRRGQALKRLEDALDALTCADVAWHGWRHGAAGVWGYGTVAEGHMLVPRHPSQSAKLA